MGDKPDTRDPSAKKVIVLGGGLAGLSASRRLLEHGYEVTLVERRPFLGGRAFSFLDRRDRVEVDNGQHVFLGCCTYYLDFLEAIGSAGSAYLQKRLRAEVVLDGKSGVLSSTSFLGRLHLLASLVGYPHLSVKEKLLVLYALLRIKLIDRSKLSAALNNESCYQWLRRHHQTDRAIDNLWNLIVLSTLNDDARKVSADMALMVFQEGFLKGPAEAAIGYSRVGLTSLNGEPARRYIEGKGGYLAMGKAVISVRVEGGRISGVELSSGEVLQADAYCSALPSRVLLQVLPGEVACAPFFSRASALRSSPIVGVHLWYDRPIMQQDFIVFLNSPVQWVFNKSLIQEANESHGQYLCISLSGAWRYVDTPKEEIKELLTREMARLFPRAREARVKRVRVIKEPHATFRSSPGAAVCRLSQATPIPNLFLAGEWTDTGWPSTMEGAVRSGVFAADALASRI